VFPETWATSLQNTDSLLLSRGPLDSNYRFFAQHLYHFRDTAHLDSISYVLCTEKKDKQLAWLQLKKALLGMGSITPSTDSLDIRGALKSFQSKQGLNPDGRIGEATVLAFAESSHAL
jgi:murein L,D-transpeptidase YcbB/YkuD